MDNLVGQIIDRYKVIEVLGKGGMGVVYKGKHTILGRDVALKIMDPQLNRDRDSLKRFEYEAKALGRLKNPHIVDIIDYRESEIGYLIVMEYVKGITIAEKIRQDGPFTIEKTLPIVNQLLNALDHAHKAGITHRDIKPSNIMLTEANAITIMDFGLAKLKDASGLTKTGTTAGTPGYMSPEQIRGEEVDHRTDIWSVGVVFYEMVTGHLPFRGEHQAAITYCILNEKPLPLKRYYPETPEIMQYVIERCLEKDPKDRYQNVTEIQTDLRDFAKTYEMTKTLVPEEPYKVKKGIRVEIFFKRWKKEIFLGLSIGMSVVIVLVTLPLWNPSDSDSTIQVPTTALMIQTEPESASIKVDGKLIGVTPIETYRVTPGIVYLQAQKGGYQTRDTTISVVEGETKRISIALQLIPSTVALSETTDTRISKKNDVSMKKPRMEGDWALGVYGEGDGRTADEALKNARYAAYAQALKLAGISVDAKQFIIQSEAATSPSKLREANAAFRRSIESGPAGIVTDTRNEKIQGLSAGSRYRYRVELDAKITKRQGERDASFNINFQLNQSVFRSGDKLILHVIPTKACYVSVFNISMDSVFTLFPNEYQNDDLVAAQTTLRLGDSGINYPVSIPKGWDSAEEMIFVVATRDKLDQLKDKGGTPTLGKTLPRDDALISLMKNLVGVSLEDGREVFRSFEIRSK
ncbi:MAG: protein kinase [Ignavibacteriae bacterium]|nr:protein kinase [Ignavibacteriota bacterium]